jgi:hypothetical protein
MVELVDKSHNKHMSDIKNVSNEIIEFEMIGFARPSDKLLDYIRGNNILVKIFNSTKTKGSNRKNGPIKIFGDYYRYYYKIEFQKEFVDFLVEKFYKNNPDPDPNIKKAFTRILHDNGLHWEWCCHARDRHKYIEKRLKKDI